MGKTIINKLQPIFEKFLVIYIIILNIEVLRICQFFQILFHKTFFFFFFFFLFIKLFFFFFFIKPTTGHDVLRDLSVINEIRVFNSLTFFGFRIYF